MRRLLLTAALAPLTVAACHDSPVAPAGSTALRFVACESPQSYWPTGGWRENCPTAMGVDSATLRKAFEHVERDLPNAYSLLVVKGGYIVGEQYYNGARESTPFDVRSMTKSVVATIAGAALHRGDLASMSTELRPIFPEYFRVTDDPRKLRLTLAHVFSMSAGFDPAGGATQPGTSLSRALTRPMRAEPGTLYFYDEDAYHAGAVAMSLLLQRDLLDYANQRLFGPLGFTVPPNAWATDAWGYTTGASGLAISARDLAKIGLLYARDGVWNGQRVLAEHWVDSASTIHSRPEGWRVDQGYGYGWWITTLSGRHTFYALGYGGQTLIVVPDLDLVTVLTSNPTVQQQTFTDYIQVMPDWVLPAVEGGREQ